MAMLFALVSMYHITRSVLGTVIVTAICGVRQGSPTSGFLFILFVDSLIKMFKSRCQDDSFLQWLHALMLMDDTVILATTRERLQEKLNVLDDFCKTHGMVINQSKTKFMAINGDPIDKLP